MSTLPETNIRELDTFDEAQNQALKEGAAIMCTPINGVLYRQSNRYMISTSLPLRILIERVRLDSVKKGEDPQIRRNRPLMPDHVKVISNYLQNEEDFILPPITLNVSNELRCFTTRTEAPTRNVVALLPPGMQFYVTDGQHRIAAIIDAVERRADLEKSAVAVNLVIEDDMDQIHQDFADCAQTKPIPSSLLAAFNSRSPLFSLLKRVTEEIPALKGRVDKTSKSIGKTSLNLFTLNQMRFCVAELLLGNSIVTADELSRSASERLTSEHKRMYEDGIVWFYQTFSQYNDVWNQIALSGGDPSRQKVDIPSHRAEYVDLTATGLQVISRVGYSIMWTDRSDREEMVQKLAQLDFKRTAPLWQGNIIEGEKLKTNNTPVKMAVAAVKQAIGLETATEDKGEHPKLEIE